MLCEESGSSEPSTWCDGFKLDERNNSHDSRYRSGRQNQIIRNRTAENTGKSGFGGEFGFLSPPSRFDNIRHQEPPEPQILTGVVRQTAHSSSSC
jgi:hypothetical protein